MLEAASIYGVAIITKNIILPTHHISYRHGEGHIM